MPKPFVPPIALLLIFAATGSAAFAQSSRQQQVLKSERLGCLAYETHNVQGIRDFLTADYTLTDSKGVVTTRQDDLDDSLKDRVHYTVFRNANMKVRLYNDAAVVTGKTHVEVSANGSSFNVDVQFTDTLVYLHGRWRLAAGHVSRIPAAK